MASSPAAAGAAVTQEVVCSVVAMTHVIGKGGVTIKSIQTESGARVQAAARPGGQGEGLISITGTPDQVAKARTLVERVIAEQENPDYEGPEGRRLRAEANAEAEERTRLMKEADRLFAAGDKQRGHETMALAKKAGERFHTKNAEAAAAILKNRNAGKGDLYLDLHGLYVAEAERFTTERLDKVASSTAQGAHAELELIPGAGHHSAGGKAAVKPAIVALLDKRQYKHEDISAGSMRVWVKGESTTAPAPAPAAAAVVVAAEPPPKKEKTSCCLVM